MLSLLAALTLATLAGYCAGRSRARYTVDCLRDALTVRNRELLTVEAIGDSQRNLIRAMHTIIDRLRNRLTAAVDELEQTREALVEATAVGFDVTGRCECPEPHVAGSESPNPYCADCGGELPLTHIHPEHAANVDQMARLAGADEWTHMTFETVTDDEGNINVVEGSTKFYVSHDICTCHIPAPRRDGDGLYCGNCWNPLPDLTLVGGES